MIERIRKVLGFKSIPENVDLRKREYLSKIGKITVGAFAVLSGLDIKDAVSKDLSLEQKFDQANPVDISFLMESKKDSLSIDEIKRAIHEAEVQIINTFSAESKEDILNEKKETIAQSVVVQDQEIYISYKSDESSITVNKVVNVDNQNFVEFKVVFDGKVVTVDIYDIRKINESGHLKKYGLSLSVNDGVLETFLVSTDKKYLEMLNLKVQDLSLETKVVKYEGAEENVVNNVKSVISGNKNKIGMSLFLGVINSFRPKI